MADLGNLEKMGRELKCPICLSLLKSAASLLCNHIFCNSCILESMKSASDCPVCKVPFHRREVRAAPHMDNLVSIYKTMELASGVNIFTSQVAPPVKSLGKETCQVVDGKKKSGTSETKVASRGKLKGKRLSGKQSKNPEKVGIKSLSKKRIHVTPYPVSETPVRTGKISKLQHPSVEHEDERADKIDPLFAPFFWLREGNEDDVPEKLSSQHIDDAFPPNNPISFSDIKDSDDVLTPIGLTPTSKTNDTEAFDSELFEWTQRACSPELCSTPVKTQEATRRPVINEIQEKVDLTNFRPGVASVNEILSEKKYSKLISPNGNAESSRTCFARTTTSKIKKKSNQKGQRNHSKALLCRSNVESLEVLPEIPVVSVDKFKELSQENRDAEAKKPDNLVSRGGTPKKKPSRRHMRKLVKRSINQFKLGLRVEALKKFPTKCTTAKGQKQVSEGVGIESPASMGMEKINVSTPVEITKTGKRSNASIVVFQRKKKRKTMDVAVAKTLKDSKDKQEENDKPSLSRGPENNKSQTNLDRLKKKRIVRVADVAVARDNDTLPVTSLEDAQFENNQCDTNLQSPASFPAKNSSMIKVLDSVIGANVLRKCNKNESQIVCAFCQSSDDTEISGEMMHYFSGKPVSADYNEGFNVVHSHKNCTEWAPDVYFEDDLAINLAAELARSRRIKCSCCGIKGAALGCYEKSCRRSFHFTCAKLTPECRWDNENFVMLCPLHSSLELPSESTKPHKQQRKRSSPKLEMHTSSVRLTGDKTGKWTWPSGSPCKWVLCCSALTDAEKDIVSEFTSLTGVSVSKSWSPAVSHIIASTDENGACKRTLKFLMGILEGKWILSINWIKACMEVMEPVDEEQYEITMDTHGISGGPLLGRLRIIDQRPKLFNGLRFYFNGEFKPSYKGYLQDLVTAAGGTILQRKPISRDREKLLDDPPVSGMFIIYNLEVLEKQKLSADSMAHRRAEAQNLADCCGAKIAGNLWIVDSIAACNLQPLA